MLPNASNVIHLLLSRFIQKNVSVATYRIKLGLSRVFVRTKSDVCALQVLKLLNVASHVVWAAVCGIGQVSYWCALSRES